MALAGQNPHLFIFEVPPILFDIFHPSLQARAWARGLRRRMKNVFFQMGFQAVDQAKTRTFEVWGRHQVVSKVNVRILNYFAPAGSLWQKSIVFPEI